MIIAIDGPAGAGKSTIAKGVAKRLGIQYLDTGAMYRAFTLFVLNRNINPEDKEKIRKALEDFKITLNGDRVYLNGKDVTSDIRGEKVTDHVSYISSLEFVRKKMVELQQNIGKNNSIVAEGRDIGTVVFPDAEFKFFLDATIEERARRRMQDEKNPSKGQDLKSVMEKLKQRDDYDSNRYVSPLRKAPDALYIDSTKMSVDEICDIIVRMVKEDL
ncbi:MAG: (d)CMP kinase [Spirochaetota bacterium]